MSRGFVLRFEGDVEYSTEGPAMEIGPGLGHGNPVNYHMADGLVVISFGSPGGLGGYIWHKIPERRLLDIVEWSI